MWSGCCLKGASACRLIFSVFFCSCFSGITGETKLNYCTYIKSLWPQTFSDVPAQNGVWDYFSVICGVCVCVCACAYVQSDYITHFQSLQVRMKYINWVITWWFFPLTVSVTYSLIQAYFSFSATKRHKNTCICISLGLSFLITTY